jgi:hypothetical protein
VNAANLPAEIELPKPARVGQGTAIEQARSVAEVHAQIMAARQLPRDIQAARRSIVDSCAISEFAAKAFYRYPRGGQTVTGPSIHMARELARCWGNIDYGIKELSRDDEHGQSEMIAFAWDMESNVRNSNVFIVPHKRDKRGGPEALVDMRDIYENNANNGARRVRQAIFSVLPPWYVELALAAAHTTNKDGGGKPLQERIATMLSLFRAIDVSEEDIARKVGRQSAKWTGDDVAQLGTVYASIQRGEVTKDEEFPESAVTSEEITGSEVKP